MSKNDPNPLPRGAHRKGADSGSEPVRTWDQVADEFNRRNPDLPPLSRANAWTIHREAVQKLKAMFADHPEIMELMP